MAQSRSLSWLSSSKSLHASSCRTCKSIWPRRSSWRSFGAITSKQKSISKSLSQSIFTTSAILKHMTAPKFYIDSVNRTISKGIHISSRQCNTVTAEVGNSPIHFSTGKYAKLASGSALVESGSSSVLVTAVSEYKADPSANFLPLLVDYRERGSATNKIPQTFFRRELKPSTKEYLASRFIDRSIRPMFPRGYYYNTQVICNMLAVDGQYDHEILAVNGAAAALMLSDIPWKGPVGAVRVCLVDNEFCINPSSRTQNSSQLNMVVACTKDRIVMVEGSAEEIPEEKLCEAVKFAFNEAQPLIDSLSKLAQYQRAPTRESTLFLPSEHVKETVKNLCAEKVMIILSDTSHSKMTRDKELFSLLDQTKEEMVTSDSSVNNERVADAFWMIVKQHMQDLVLDKGVRCDGRGFTELRDIECEVDTFKPLHGTAVFRRGESQVLCTVTFDAPGSALKADILQMLLGAQKTNSFMVHYEFPPFATNTIGYFMNHNRREAGHGALAEKALAPLIPNNFPFTIRLNSQVLDSNGSTSMATICGGSLALFDAGVPMPRPAAGVACGLVARTNPESGEIEKYQIITDLLGIEDANGNMDFKIGGTREGITSLQVDVKDVPGIPIHIFEEAVMQSKAARHQVLDIMDKCLSSPREELKKNRPAHTILEVAPDKIGRLLGVGAHRLKGIAEDTGTTFTLLDEGKISVFAPSQEAIDEFLERVDSTLKEEECEFEIGSVLEVKVVEVRDTGLMMELAPRIFSLLHISRISHDFLSHPSEVGLKEGDKVSVKYLGKDFLGRHQISRKALIEPDKSAEKNQSQKRHVANVKFEIGEVIEATVKDIRDFGVMVELAPGVKSLLHIRNLAHEFVRHPSELNFRVGDKIAVKYIGSDHLGRHEVSRKALLPEPTDLINQTITVQKKQ